MNYFRKGTMPLLFLLFVSLAAPIAYGSGARAVGPPEKSLGDIVFERYPELRGVQDYSLKAQNEIADRKNLLRFEKQKDISEALKSRYLVPVPASSANFYLDSRLPKEFRCISPQTLIYIERISGKLARKSGSGVRFKRIDITSLVRTEKYQRKLSRKNPNAASGDDLRHRSLHTTGFTFDFSTKKTTRAEVLWFAEFLADDMREGRVWVTYEPNNNNFHIFVIPQ